MSNVKTQSAYSLSESAKSKMRDLIRLNEGPILHPYLDSKGIITIGVGFNVDSKDEFQKLNLRKEGKNGPLMSEDEKKAAYDAMVKKRTEEKGNYQNAGKYEGVTVARINDTDVNAKLDIEIADRVPKIREKIGAEAWDKLTDGQKATITAVHFNIGSLDGSPKLVEAAKKGDAAGIAKESHVVANKVKNDKGEVTKHERNWEAVMRNHCGALGLDAGSDACWRSVAAEYKDKPEDQRKLETFPPSMQKILDEPAKPDEKLQEPPKSTEPPTGDAPQSSEPPVTEEPRQPEPELRQEKQSDLGENGRAFQDKLAQPVARPGLEAALKEPGQWTKEERDNVVQDYMRYQRPEPVNQWLRDQTTEHFKQTNGEDVQNTLVQTPDDIRLAQKSLERLGRNFAPAFDADGMSDATKAMQRGLNLINQDKLPKLKEDGNWGPITDFSFKKSANLHNPARLDEGFALGRLHSLAENPQMPEDLAKRTQDILGPLYGSHQGGKDLEPHHAIALQAGLNQIGPNYADPWQPLKLDGEIGPKTASAFNQVTSAAGPQSFTQQFGNWLGWVS